MNLHLSRRSFLTAALASSVAPVASKATGTEPTDAGIVLPQGLTLFPPESIEVTFQVLPFYSETEKVLAVWRGEDLQYFISLTTIPNEWTAEKYFAGFKRDLSAAAEGPLAVGRQSAYDAHGRLRGHVLELSYRPRDAEGDLFQVVHFLSDGHFIVLAFASSPAVAVADAMFKSSIALFKTARVTHQAQPTKAEESPYVGTWGTEAQLEDGRGVTVVWQLKSDLSFATQMRIDGALKWAATGVWHVDGNTLTSEYLHSKPLMPDRAKTDQDEIQAFDGQSLTLRSKRTGKVTRFVRQ